MHTLEKYFKEYNMHLAIVNTWKKIKKFRDELEYMQRRIKDKIITLNSKVDIINNQWEKMAFVWYQKAKAIKD